MSIPALVPDGPGGGRFLEDIPLCFVTCFLVLRVFDVVVLCYLGSYSFVVRDLHGSIILLV